MKRIFLYFSLLLILVTLNIYFTLYQNDPIEVTYQPEAAAETQVGSVLTFDTTPVEHVSLIVTGDIMLGRTVMTKSMELNDHLYPFRKVYQEMDDADLIFVNLENPIVEGCPVHTGGFKFCSPPESVGGLTLAGVDVVTLANNHSLNYGYDGLEQTIKFLNDNGIATTGSGELIIKVVKGTRFGFLGFDHFSNAPTDLELITESKEAVDVLVVGIHWGAEYKDVANTFQRAEARKIIEAGADIIVGHHPHWVQDMDCFLGEGENFEIINIKREEFGVKSCPEESKRVYYSLGNFIFDQMWSEETKKGMTVRLVFEGTDIVSEEFLPVYMREWAQPEWVNDGL